MNADYKLHDKYRVIITLLTAIMLLLSSPSVYYDKHVFGLSQFVVLIIYELAIDADMFLLNKSYKLN